MASRTHFEVLGLEGQVLGLGLEASSPRKLTCSRLGDSTIFRTVKIMYYYYYEWAAVQADLLPLGSPTHCIGLNWAHGNCSCYVAVVWSGYPSNSESLPASFKYVASLQRWAQITLYQKRSVTIFLISKIAAQMRNFNFLLSEAQRNLRNELFDSVEA